MVIKNSLFKAVMAIALTLCISGCYHDVHEFGPSEYGGKTSVGYMTTSLQWADTADAGTPIRNIFLVFGGSGNKLSRYYVNDEEASMQLQQLPTGNYDLLATINMTAEEGFVISGMPATKAGSRLGSISVSIKDSTRVANQAWYGVGKATINNKSISKVDISLQRLLPVFKLSLTDLPNNAGVSFVFNNLAREIILTSADNSLSGVPGSDSYDSFNIESLNANAGGRLDMDIVLPPTVSGIERIQATMIITTTLGNKTFYSINMPRIDGGKSYSLALNYANIQPDMYLNSTAINDWTDGWTVAADIPDPQQ